MIRRLGILLSGRGSNFLAIAKAIEQGRLDAEIALVASNVPDAPGLAAARDLGLATWAQASKGVPRAAFDQAIGDALDAHGCDLICLAGYLRLLSPGFIQRFPQRILNIHPSLLPAFPGLDAQHQAWAHGVRVTGCTVHFVDEDLDNGPIIAQTAVPVEEGDSAQELSARILAQEHLLYPAAIARVLAGGWRIEGRRFVIVG